MLIHAGKYKREDKLKTQTIHNPEKANAKQNYPGLVASYDTRPANEVKW